MKRVVINCESDYAALNVICAVELFLCLTPEEQAKFIGLLRDSLSNRERVSSAHH